MFAVVRSYSLLAALCGFPPLPSERLRAGDIGDELLLVLAHCLCGKEIGTIEQESALQEQCRKAQNIEHIHGSQAQWIEHEYRQACALHDVATYDSAQSIIEKRWQTIQNSIERVPEHYGVQAWMMASWEASPTLRMQRSDSHALAQTLLAPAPLCLRVNTLKADRRAVAEQLKSEGIDVEDGLLSPSALIIRKRVNLLQHPLYVHGMIEIQDEASQLLGYAVHPAPTDVILDACAGAGGKSLHLGALQGNRGRIISADIEFGRLKEIAGRAERAGITSIKTIHTKSAVKHEDYTLPRELQSLVESVSAVVVDAPCSGMGTIRRQPMVKWTLTPDILRKHQAKQQRVLAQYAQAVQRGGVLVYATCSLMPEENEHVAEFFTRTYQDFQPEPLAPIFSAQGITVPYLDSDAYFMNFSPSRHHTDGFFVARWRRL